MTETALARPIAAKRIDALFDVEREISGLDPAARLEARKARAAPLVAALELWLRAHRAQLSKHAKVNLVVSLLCTPTAASGGLAGKVDWPVRADLA